MENQNKEELKQIAQNFYNTLSTTPSDSTSSSVTRWMASDWVSIPTPAGGAGLEGFVNTLHMFHGMFPDLNWEVQEMLIDGNRVVVRSIARGTPSSSDVYFFGKPTDGSKYFEIMTIDIHTIENGKLTQSFHVEDWTTAIQQVSNS